MIHTKKTKIVFIIAAVLAVVSAFSYMSALNSDFDPIFGYFAVGAAFAVITYVTLGAAVVLGIVSWLLCFRDVTLKSGAFKQNPASTIASILLAFGIAVNFLQEVLVSGTQLDSRFIFLVYFSRLFAILSVASLIINALIKYRSKTFACLFSFFTPLYFASKVLCYYFNQSVAVNSQPKIIVQLTFIVLTLVFTAEAGLSLGRGQIYHRYTAVLAVASVFSFACGAAGIVNSINTVLTPYTLTESLMLLLAGVYCLIALYNCSNLNFVKADDKYSEFFEIMQRKADERNGGAESAREEETEETEDKE